MTRFRLACALIIGLPGSMGIASAAPPTVHPVVLELFTSNSCSSCPPAYAALDRLAADTDPAHPLIRLDEHVDYWNQLDWVDRYSRAQFTKRQRRYANHVLHDGQVYTPQLVIDGRVGLIGSRENAARRDIEKLADRVAPLSPAISRNGRQVTVDVADVVSRPAGKVWVALTQDQVISHVGRGENAGRTLRENGVVRTLIGVPSGTSHVTLVLPHHAPLADLHVVAFVQRADGQIIAAGQRSLDMTSHRAS